MSWSKSVCHGRQHGLGQDIKTAKGPAAWRPYQHTGVVHLPIWLSKQGQACCRRSSKAVVVPVSVDTDGLAHSDALVFTHRTREMALVSRTDHIEPLDDNFPAALLGIRFTAAEQSVAYLRSEPTEVWTLGQELSLRSLL